MMANMPTEPAGISKVEPMRRSMVVAWRVPKEPWLTFMDIITPVNQIGYQLKYLSVEPVVVFCKSCNWSAPNAKEQDLAAPDPRATTMKEVNSVKSWNVVAEVQTLSFSLHGGGLNCGKVLKPPFGIWEDVIKSGSSFSFSSGRSSIGITQKWSLDCNKGSWEGGFYQRYKTLDPEAISMLLYSLMVAGDQIIRPCPSRSGHDKRRMKAKSRNGDVFI
nr:hypothetical protein Iba_chr02dCG7040 [Ipomoea batatas]